MKIAAAILLLVFMTFSLQPLLMQTATAVNTGCSNKVTCCKRMSHNITNKTPEKKDNSCKDCNQLMLCPICCVYLQPDNFYSSSLNDAAGVKNSFSNFFILSSYHPESWHPPE